MHVGSDLHYIIISTWSIKTCEVKIMEIEDLKINDKIKNKSNLGFNINFLYETKTKIDIQSTQMFLTNTNTMLKYIKKIIPRYN
jgi:hypothetical protein